MVVRGFDRDIDSDGNERLWDRQEIFVSFVSLSEAGCSHARGFAGLTAVIIGQFLRQKASCQYYPVIRYAPLGQMYLLPAGFGLLAMLPLVYDVWQWMVRSLEERKQGNTDAHIAMAQYLEQTYGVPYHERKARETREGEM